MTDQVPGFEEQAALVYGDGFCPDGGYIDKAIVDQWWHISTTARTMPTRQPVDHRSSLGNLMPDEDWPCVSRRGPSLWCGRLRHVVLDRIDRFCHRHLERRHCWNHWPCFQSADAELWRILHDQRYHQRVFARSTPVEVTGPPQ